MSEENGKTENRKIHIVLFPPNAEPIALSGNLDIRFDYETGVYTILELEESGDVKAVIAVSNLPFLAGKDIPVEIVQSPIAEYKEPFYT